MFMTNLCITQNVCAPTSTDVSELSWWLAVCLHVINDSPFLLVSGRDPVIYPTWGGGCTFFSVMILNKVLFVSVQYKTCLLSYRTILYFSKRLATLFMVKWWTQCWVDKWGGQDQRFFLMGDTRNGSGAHDWWRPPVTCTEPQPWPKLTPLKYIESSIARHGLQSLSKKKGTKFAY